MPLVEWWGLEKEFRQTNDPTVPAATTGSTLDRVLLSPGYCIPSTFTPPDFRGRPLDTDAGGPLRPAMVMPHFVISDHHPIVLPIPCDIDSRSVATERPKVGAPSEVDWGDRNTAMAGALADASEDLEGLAHHKIIGRFSNSIERLVKFTLESD